MIIMSVTWIEGKSNLVVIMWYCCESCKKKQRSKCGGIICFKIYHWKPVLDTLNRILHVFALDPVHSYFFNCRSSFAVLIYSILHCSYMLLIEFSCIYILGIVCKNCLMKYLLRSPIISSWWVWRHQTLFSHPTHRYVWCIFSLRNRLTCN